MHSVTGERRQKPRIKEQQVKNGRQTFHSAVLVFFFDDDRFGDVDFRQLYFNCETRLEDL